MMVLGWSSTIFVLAVVFGAGAWMRMPPSRDAHLAFVQRNLLVFIPALALLLVWAIAIGTRLATGEWPEPGGLMATDTCVFFVESRPDSAWSLLQFFAQLMLAASAGIAISTPIRWAIDVLHRRGSSVSRRRSLLGFFCASLIVASYASTPGRNAIDWIID